MRRREFIVGLGSAAAWPVVARAQQPAMPVVGYLSGATPEPNGPAGLLKGLSETGFIEGRNLTMEYRYSSAYERLPEFAAELVRRRANVIVTIGLAAAFAAKAQTSTIPIVFATQNDSVQYGLVSSLNQPGGNVTGINTFGEELGAKRLRLLHDLLPVASRFAFLVDPMAPSSESAIKDVQTGAVTLGKTIEIVAASTNGEIDDAFKTIVGRRVEALLVAPSTLFLNRRVQVTSLAIYHHLPAMYGFRAHTDSGGLMSYGSNPTDEARQAGIYVGRILKGEKPANLPVMRPTKLEFVINLQAARILEIEIPPQLLAIADEVIE
jgi:putative tryptophan/tyrosine transport system substrate-binding protein